MCDAILHGEIRSYNWEKSVCKSIESGRYLEIWIDGRIFETRQEFLSVFLKAEFKRENRAINF